MSDAQSVVRKWLALWNGDKTLLDDLVAEAVVTHAVMVGQMVEAPMMGRDALGGWIAQIHEAIPGLHFAIEVGPLVDGDLIALRWRVANQDGSKRINFAGTDILRVADGRVAEYWVSSDTSLMMAQMQAADPLS